MYVLTARKEDGEYIRSFLRELRCTIRNKDPLMAKGQVFEVDVMLEAMRGFERQTYFERFCDSVQEEGFEDAMTVELFGSAPVVHLESDLMGFVYA